mmetsp:Transcript_109263/g.305694  ORF Transcript_109263/g.305694 Transcript_109263/m.305694 type:complete len:250 (+) Transcript_109263:92-841(+)
MASPNFDWQARWPPSKQERHRSLVRNGAARGVPADPTPSEVDSRSCCPLPGHPVLVMLLCQPLHGTEIPRSERDPAYLGLPRGRIGPKLEGAGLAEGERDDWAILRSAAKELLVVRMPTHRHTAVLVEVEVATIRPSVPLQATQRHTEFHELRHPLRELGGSDLDAAVAVGAPTPTGDHPSGLPRENFSGAPAWLRPMGRARDALPELSQHLRGERRRQEACEATPRLVPQRIPPATVGDPRRDVAEQP